MPNVEQYANLAQSTLNGAIIAGDLSLVLTDASAFPAAGDFRLLIDTEIIRCTARSSNTLTVVRAQEGTTAAAHGNGATVTAVLTAASLQAVSGSINLDGTYAAKPAAGVVGRLLLPSDGMSLYRDDGSLWVPAGPLSAFTEPIFADFAWSNQGTATVDTTPGGIFINALAQGGGEDPKIFDQPVPGTTPWTITTYLDPLAFPANFWEAGMRLRDNAGAAVTVGFNFNATLNFSIDKFNSNFSYNSTYGTFPSLGQASFWAAPPHWFQITDNGTNRITRLSSDGQHWLQVHSVGRTDFITPTRIGFFANAINSTFDCGILLRSWKKT